MVCDLHDFVHEDLFRAKRDVQQHEVGTCDVAVIEQWALKGFADGLDRTSLSRRTSGAHDGPSTVAHDGVHIVHVDVDFARQRDDFCNAFGRCAEDLVGIGKGTADGLVAKQLPEFVVADDEQGVHGLAHGVEPF